MPGDEYRSVRAQIPPPVEDLVGAFRSPITQIEFLRLIHESVILRPVHVQAVADELGLADEWIGSYNREVQTLPVLEFRESATRLGLLHKHKGKLLATPRGRKLRDDPAALWWHLAQSLPPRKADRPVVHAGLLLLAAVAAWPEGDVLEYVARMLSEAGWANRDGTDLTQPQARGAAGITYPVLVRLGALVRNRRDPKPDEPTRDGALFARAALRTWPPAGR